MKFTIEVKDFWLEEEELTEALAGHIKQSVINQIAESVKVQVERQITSSVKEVVETKVALVIDSVLTDLVATQIIKFGGKEITITEYLKGVFEGSHGWGNPTKQMQDIAKKFGDELKIQYNNIFANKIVQNMKEQGLLKDEVVQILLGGSDAKK